MKKSNYETIKPFPVYRTFGVFLLLFLFSTFPLKSQSAVITVPGDCATIQGAIDAAVHGNEIIVSPGTYYENIHFDGKNIILRSTDPTNSDVVASTIIDGRSSDTVVTLSGTELTTCVLSGFTITNGKRPIGGGICGYGTHATIQYNTITHNRATERGEAIGGGLYDCDGTIQYNTISLNDAFGTFFHGTATDFYEGSTEGYGGGLAYCSGIIRNNIISYNTADHAGGLYECDGVIQNNIISGNGAYAFVLHTYFIGRSPVLEGSNLGKGGGVYECDGSILSNTIWGNETNDSVGGMFSCNGIIKNCIIWANEQEQLSASSAPTYSCIQGWSGGGSGNISADPRFVGPSAGNFHLDSISPCIDAGGYIHGLTQDFEGHTRPFDAISWESRGDGSDFDMGAYEYIQTIPPPLPRGTIVTIPYDYPTIQAAINAAGDGVEIIVSPGTYPENIDFLGKNILLHSTEPSSETIVASTIIDGTKMGCVVTFLGSEETSCVLSGFTITNGEAYYCGGISGNGCKTTIENNIITGNSAQAYSGGGGIYDCDGLIQNNTISDNSAKGDGGGLYGCDGIIRNNIISGNSEGGLETCNAAIQNNSIYNNGGGGLYYCSGTIENNYISNNWRGGIFVCNGIIQNNTILSNHGGGLSECNGTIQNNTICGNSAEYHGGGLSYCNGIIQNNTIANNSATSAGGGLRDCHGTIRNCIIWGNTAPAYAQLENCSKPLYCCTQAWTGGGAGNISSDPRFVDPVNGNYHLQADSPCIDAGNVYYYLLHNPIVDVDGECRIVGDAVDIGSDEFGSSPDSDGDLLADSYETIQACDANNPDTDGDGLADGPEVLRGTSPRVPNTPSGIFVPSQFASIQQGLFFAFPLEVITVSPGTYNENIDFLGKDVILRSTDPTSPSIMANTIIDGNHEGSVVSFLGNESPQCVLSGFTIRNGRALKGGGVYGNGCKATIEHNIIIKSSAYTYDRIERYGDGGGLWECDGTIQSNIISENSAEAYGGGLKNCDGMIENNIISANSALYGGALYSCHGIIQNNTIWGNSALWAGGVYYCVGTIRNCIIWQNAPWEQVSDSVVPTYSCIQDWTGGGTGNISEYPEFIDPGNGDFHLRPFSPSIDAGRDIPGLTQDFEGDTRPYDGTSEPRGDGSDFDMGADEYAGFGPSPDRTLISYLYYTILNREPEQGAVPAWEVYLNYALDFDVSAHFIAGDIGWRILSSSEYAGRNRSREEFIRDCYRGFLLRDPSSWEVDAWLNGSWSREEVISIFVNSDEFMGLMQSMFPGCEGDPIRNFIAQVYMGILGRLVDGGAVEAWEGFLRGTSDKRDAMKWMAGILFHSEEYASKSPSNRDRVISLYRGLLGRFPNDNEISYWEEELNSGRKTLEELIDIFCDSPEFSARLIEFFGTAGSSPSTETRVALEHETASSPLPPQQSPITEVPDWESY
jgi:hypothetical protein